MLQTQEVLQNRYQLERQLGDNGVRQTWLARDLQATEVEHELVVVKMLAFGGAVQWDDLKLFEREAQILKAIDHPRIPNYIDYFCVDDRTLWFGLVEEYIAGESFKDLLNRGQRFSEKQVRKIAKEVLQILIHLHELNPVVLHRDIKPSNLIYGEDEHVYLVDFGAVQDKAAREGVTFTVVGTYGYAPMEQFGGKAVPASDLYALGTTLIHLLTGISPADLPQKDLRVQFSDHVNLSPAFMSWLQRMVEPAPENRFQTAQQAYYALRHGAKKPSYNSSLAALTKERFINNSGCGISSQEMVPEEILGWNWGAFLMPWLWLWTNNVWLGLLCFIPNVGFVMTIILGVKGNEWAWKSRRWRSIEHFKQHQRGWAIAGILLGAPLSFLLWLVTFAAIAGIFV